MKNSQKL